MPIRVICRKCGFILYEGNELVSPRSLASKYGYLCPRCFSKLKPQAQSIWISPHYGLYRYKLEEKGHL